MRHPEIKIKEFISKLAKAIDFEEEKITPNSKLSDMNWDSLAYISAIAIADQCFDVVISIEKLSECETIDDIINLTY